MKVFSARQVDEAVEHAKGGGQALHLHRFIANRATAPRCFVRAVDWGEDIAHLFDLDEVRLERTARKLGVRVIVIERGGTVRQHIDLCGGPLRRAVAMADRTAAGREGVPRG